MRSHSRFPLLTLALMCAAVHAADPVAEKRQSLEKLRAAITQGISTPCGIKPKQRVEIKLMLQENGYIRSIGLVQSSGAPAFDAEVMSAITGAQPYSLPSDPATRKELQNLDLRFDAFASPIPTCRK